MAGKHSTTAGYAHCKRTGLEHGTCTHNGCTQARPLSVSDVGKHTNQMHSFAPHGTRTAGRCTQGGARLTVDRRTRQVHMHMLGPHAGHGSQIRH